MGVEVEDSGGEVGGTEHPEVWLKVERVFVVHGARVGEGFRHLAG